MKKTLTILMLFLVVLSVKAQRFTVESSHVKFYSHAPVEDIEANNTESSSIIDLATGDMVFSIPIRAFQFEKSLMQEHFNENYLESHKYPAATFTATGVDWEPFSGEKEVLVAGTLSIHGEKNQAEMKGTMTVEKKRVVIDAVFKVQIEDYKIKVPKALFYNIAETIEVTVHFEYKPLKK